MWLGASRINQVQNAPWKGNVDILDLHSSLLTGLSYHNRYNYELDRWDDIARQSIEVLVCGEVWQSLWHKFRVEALRESGSLEATIFIRAEHFIRSCCNILWDSYCFFHSFPVNRTLQTNLCVSSLFARGERILSIQVRAIRDNQRSVGIMILQILRGCSEAHLKCCEA